MLLVFLYFLVSFYILGQEKNSAELVIQCDYLKITDCGVVLKKKHMYYSQIQLGMAILNIPECDFVIYSKFSKSFVNIIVPRDDLFLNNMLNKLQDIYFLYMIHEICLNT